MNRSVLYTGGARSGKSRAAEEAAASRERVAYIATAEALDEEMALRIRRHRQKRSPHWETFEVPRELAEQLRALAPRYEAILVDCITLWVSNLMEAKLSDAEILERADDLARLLRSPSCLILVVTNEVGTGIVPVSVAGRRFRDLAGLVNQRLAAASHSVIWMVAGLAVTIKGDPP